MKKKTACCQDYGLSKLEMPEFCAKSDMCDGIASLEELEKSCKDLWLCQFDRPYVLSSLVPNETHVLPDVAYILVEAIDMAALGQSSCVHLVMKSGRRLIYKKKFSNEEEAKTALDLVDDKHVVLSAAWCKSCCPTLYEHAKSTAAMHCKSR